MQIDTILIWHIVVDFRSVKRDLEEKKKHTILFLCMMIILKDCVAYVPTLATSFCHLIQSA